MLKLASSPMMSTVGLAPEEPIVSPFIFLAINVTGSPFTAASQIDRVLRFRKAG